MEAVLNDQYEHVLVRHSRFLMPEREDPDFLYEMKDAEGVLKLFQACPYEQPYFLTEGISVRFSDVGHLLGSASIELTVEENDIRKVIVFSGDIGNINQPLIKDPTYLEGGSPARFALRFRHSASNI